MLFIFRICDVICLGWNGFNVLSFLFILINLMGLLVILCIDNVVLLCVLLLVLVRIILVSGSVLLKVFVVFVVF